MRALLLTALFTPACIDAPYFVSVLPPRDTTDVTGPYIVQVFANAPNGMSHVVLRLTDKPSDDDASDDLFADVPMALGDGDVEQGRYDVELPGRPPGTLFRFYLVAVDQLEQSVTYPEVTPRDTLSFRVLDAALP